MKKDTMVVSGSSSLPELMEHWKEYWLEKGHDVLAWPEPINSNNLKEVYPVIHKNFYAALATTDVHFIANEKKNGVDGYIGPGVFAEISFRIALNLINKSHVPIILLRMPADESFFYNDIRLWESFGWLQIFDETVQ